jgi:hypothetical protein
MEEFVAEAYEAVALVEASGSVVKCMDDDGGGGNGFADHENAFDRFEQETAAKATSSKCQIDRQATNEDGWNLSVPGKLSLIGLGRG